MNAAHALSFLVLVVREDALSKSQDWGVNDAVPLGF